VQGLQFQSAWHRILSKGSFRECDFDFPTEGTFMSNLVPMSDVIAALEQIGASIDYDEAGRVSRLVLVGQHLSDQELKILGFLGDSIRRLNVIYTNIRGPGLAYCRCMRFLERLDLGANVELTDLALAYLKPLTSMDMLRLWDTKISDKGLEHLTELRRLRWLYLSGTVITDSGLSTLKRMTMLRGLDLRATKITDRGLKQLGALENLEWLDLSDTRIDGTGLSYLSGLPKLERVHLRHTYLDPSAIEKFKRIHPTCHLDTMEAQSQ
jgi:hypothetical protein